MLYVYFRRALIETDEQFSEQKQVVEDYLASRGENLVAENIVFEEIAISAQTYPKLEELLGKLDTDDELVVLAPDRLAGSARSFYDRCVFANKRGAFITVVRPPVFVSNVEQPQIKPTTFKASGIEMFILEMIASIDKQDRNERTNATLKKTGKKGGRPPALSQEQIDRMRQMFEDEATQDDVSKEFGISQATVSRYYNEIILQKGRTAPSPRRQDPVIRREKRRIYERKRRQRLKETVATEQ